MSHRPLFQDRAVERPTLPSCQDLYLPFSADWEFDSCRSEMEAYQRELNSYLDCLSSEADQAIAEYNAAVADFNRRAELPKY